jgi:hypothetical protein
MIGATRSACVFVFFALCANLALAGPMKYSGTVVTDIRLGNVSYHNATVTLTFLGDTKDIALATDANGNPILSTRRDGCSGTGWFFVLSKGKAEVSITSKRKTRVAHLDPGQVFVALDICNGGIGFGSFIGPNGLEPVYPMGFTSGTSQTKAYYDSSSSLSSLSGPINVTGNVWSCIGFPVGDVGTLTGQGYCASPDQYPLHSDLGDVFFYQTYLVYIDPTVDGSIANFQGTLNRGTFSAWPLPSK